MKSSPITETTIKAWLLLVLIALGGCSDCRESTLDSTEEWLREDPQRPGKVGVLVGLQVAQSARGVAEWRMRRGDDPCDIQWRLDEPFAVDFDLEIKVQRSSWGRRWSERGQWRRDEDNRWMIDSQVEFSGGDDLSGVREYRVYGDEDDFFEWLGPDLAARHSADSKAKRHWQREFGGRFSGLMTLVSAEWQQADDDGHNERWVPGGRPRLCGPVDGTDQVPSWRPILNTRATRKRAFIHAEKRSDDGGACRVLEASYRLERGGEMKIRLRECRGEAPQIVQPPQVGRIVDVDRDKSKSATRRQLQRWIEKGLVVQSEKEGEQ